ncbi:putative GNAT family acetyltransferase [Podospora didyma]|uniref:GNAT family acetyltransferase n=1 Tax=Podospora didyma TaxID=330526 RepID=A0AAE0K9H9_9PEZI|nr:putative GNAT family acetyltransferase [Podospora didyma]
MSNNPTPPILPEGYTLHPGFPSITNYCHLRAASGLTPKTEAQAAPIPKGSWYGCFITFSPPAVIITEASTPEAEKTVTVAMGRIIGDGGWYYHIVDMAVLPEHQRKGLGDAVLKHLLAYIQANSAEGLPYVNLFADPPGRKLYERNGFVDALPGQLGMKLPRTWVVKREAVEEIPE